MRAYAVRPGDDKNDCHDHPEHIGEKRRDKGHVNSIERSLPEEVDKSLVKHA